MKKFACILASAMLALSVTACNKSPDTRDKTWTCTECNKSDNTGNFCTDCGNTKPSASGWTCSSCNASGNTGNFCSDCGQAKNAGNSTSSKPVESSSREPEISSLPPQESSESTSNVTEESLPPQESSKSTSKVPQEPVISGSAGTLEHPAKMNEWTTCQVYNAASKEDSDLNVRVTKIVRGGEAMKLLEEYNKRSTYMQIECDLSSNTELCAVYYDIQYPETWVEGAYGINPNAPSLSVCGTDGMSVKYDNSWLMVFTKDISSMLTFEGKKYHPGDTVKDCICLYAMYKDFDDYLFKIGAYKKEAYIKAF